MTDRDTVRRLTDILLPGIGEGYPFPGFAGFVESFWRFCRERVHFPLLTIPSSQWRKFQGANTMINGTRAYMTYKEILTEQRVLRQVIPSDPGRNSAIYGVNLPLEGSDPWDDVRQRADMFAVLSGAMRSHRFQRIVERLRGSGRGRSIVNNMLAVLFAAFTDADMDVCLSWTLGSGPRPDLTVFDPSGEPCLVATASWEPGESNLDTLCELGYLFPDAGLVCLSLATPSPELSERASANGIGMVCHSPPRNGRRRTGIMSTSWTPNHSSDTARSEVEIVELADHPPSGEPSRSSMPPVGCQAGQTASSSTLRVPTAVPNCS